MAEKRKRGCGFYFLCFLLIGALGQVLMTTFGPARDVSKPTPTATSTIDPMLEADAKRLTTALTAAQAVKASMRDPDSLVIETAGTNEQATLVCISYRARNGFGGMNREFVAYKDGKPTQDAVFWNKHCTRDLWNYSDRIIRRM